MKDKSRSRSKTRWIYIGVYVLFTIVAFLPPVADVKFTPEHTQDVIIQLLMVAITSYESFGFVFHIATILLILVIIACGEKAGKLFALYIGISYLIIAFVQSFGKTGKYGLVVHIGGLVAFILLGITWVWSAFQGDLHTRFQPMSWRSLALLPFALLAFWSPYQIVNGMVRPDFDPVLLLNSPDYGLAFCLTTPVFLFLLMQFFPKVNLFAYRITAFNGLLYALFNLSHWFDPATRWTGFLHIPLLVISVVALWQTAGRKGRNKEEL